MRFELDRAPLSAGEAEGGCWLLTNGLGGFMSASAAFSVTRADQGILVAAASPSRRFTLIHRLGEELVCGGRRTCLSTQSFDDGTSAEDGWKRTVSRVWDGTPQWRCVFEGVTVTRRCGMAYGKNASGVTYDIENASGEPCTLTVTPSAQMAPKGEPPRRPGTVTFENNCLRGGGLTVHIRTNGRCVPTELRWERLRYADDAPDGRSPFGYAAVCCAVSLSVPAGERGTLELAFSDTPDSLTGGEIVAMCRERQKKLLEESGFSTPEAKELARAADAFVVHRASTGGKTVIAGYPFFGDWGRDTMIALPGCTLSTGRFQDAKSILRTFIAYERDGLLPNFFPEGQEEPQYNSADAPLLFINGVWLYYERTGDAGFVREAWPTVKKILTAYERGTRYAIRMDSDGLISAGEGLDQVTWMDVRVGDILPTPRHGKPVEINAYWYSDLRAAARIAAAAGEDGSALDALADRVRDAFNEKFWMEDRGYLRDVLSGTAADTQLRCNQIWAVSMPFTALSPERERRVVETVEKHLYTSRGLRTLSPEDPEFHPVYGGPQLDRDLAYHQGTVWPFPAGAWYLAYLKVHGRTPRAAAAVRRLLAPMADILREGCVGQIPEIYDGLEPGPSRGCFAQAWSVGELLRVYEELEKIEEGAQ